MHQTKLSLTPSSRNTRRRSRSKSQQPRDPKDDIIEIDDSSEEEDDMSMDEPADVAEVRFLYGHESIFSHLFC